jgi:Tol biopolymer transport system component
MLTTSRFPRALPALLLATVAAGLLAPVGTEPAEAAFPGANGTIAFVSSRTTGPGVTNPTGDPEIFTMNPDGTGIVQITDNTWDDSDPAWSADGNWLAYSSSREIFMWKAGYVDSDGTIVLGGAVRLTTNTADDTEPSFSPDGTRIAFRSTRDSGNSEIYVMKTDDSDNDGDGDNQTRLTNHFKFDRQPAWSPDGNTIAFVSDRGFDDGIYVMDRDGTNQVGLGNTTGLDFDPNWSPDGTRIVFTNWEDGKTPQIWIMNADGSAPKRLTKGAAANESPAWSPDGARIAFQTTRGGGDFEIYVMKAKPESRKNRPKNLTKNDVGDSKPDWRPIP